MLLSSRLVRDHERDLVPVVPVIVNCFLWDLNRWWEQCDFVRFGKKGAIAKNYIDEVIAEQLERLLTPAITNQENY